MATITPAAVFPVTGVQAPAGTYSGTFIPTVWSSKLNVKFYAATTFGDVSNTNWEGEVKSMGDKVIINNIPNITIGVYTVGGTLNIQVPVPEIIELQIDKGYYFAVNVSDVMEYQSQPNLMDLFTTDAANQMKIAVDQECFLSVATGAHASNVGTGAGILSGAYSMGTDALPIELVSGPSGTPAGSLNILGQITAMASILDEQNVPETDRFLLLTPFERNLLMSTNLAQAQFMGDATSIVRNGKIGRIDRFDVYVSNLLPKGAAGQDYPTVVGSAGITDATAVKRHAIFAGHKSAWTFASQINKVETLPNHLDFGQIVRGLVIYGRKVVKPEGYVILQVKG